MPKIFSIFSFTTVYPIPYTIYLIPTRGMPLSESQKQQVQTFFNQSHFDESGGVVTDLDGTAIHEFEGRYSIPQSVELGLNKIYELGRPVVLNTLRFPLSVIRTFGKEWYKISNAPIPCVLLNGSQIGLIHQSSEDAFAFEEIDAFPLEKEEIQNTVKYVDTLVNDNVLDLLVFFYPRNWQQGELIWTPRKEKIPDAEKKYLSAAKVFSSSIEDLEKSLMEQPVCMIFLLVNIPQDKLMAYQHTKPSNFVVRKGVDKQFGAEKIAQALHFDLKHSVGAGDSAMDNFLNGVGLAVHVGNPYLTFEGVMPPVKISNSSEFGELLFQLAGMQRNALQ